MKIFIWLITFFIIVGLPIAFIKELNSSFGAIPTMALAAAAYWIAKTLCKKWDSRKSSKTNTENQTEEIATELPASAPATSSDITTAVKVSTVAKRKKTTSPGSIDTDIIKSEHTTEPGVDKSAKKKKSIINRFTVTIAVLCILLTASVGTNAYMAYSNSVLQENIETLNQTVEEKSLLYKTLYSNHLNLKSEHNKTKEALSFYERYIVVLPNDNSDTYHIYGCKNCDTSHFWIYTIDDAKAANYHPCDNCCSTIELLYKTRKYGIKSFFEGN